MIRKGRERRHRHIGRSAVIQCVFDQISSAFHASLESVADYLVHYIEPNKPAVLEKPLKAALPELLNEWDRDYVYKKLYKDGNEKEHGLLFATLLAANFLGIEPLRDLCCAAIANMLRGKTPEQIMEVCSISEVLLKEIPHSICWVEAGISGPERNPVNSGA